MKAAGENAVVVMRGWRRRNPDLIVPAARDTAISEASMVRRRAFAEALRREMGHTFSVDSMAVSIASDSIGASGAVLRSRYWLARSVRTGKGPIARRIGWVDYREQWWRLGERWVFGDIEAVGELTWEPGAELADADRFPSRTGKSMSPIAIDERLREARRLLEHGFDEEHGELRPEAASQPVPLKTVQPNYPEFAREARIQGKVVLRVLVGVDGEVKSIRVSHGITGLNEAALDAVKRWIFEPAFDEEGNPIAAWVDVPIDFHL
ncbi:MAG TPA: energy transducer TonB [Candidatus Eisenbacteria bacterium]|nr:energy transducer TonB [Candidatus Eisenbacteria bacterium]